MTPASSVMGAFAGFPRTATLGTEVAVKDHEVRDVKHGHRPPDDDFDRGDGLGHKILCHRVLTPRTDELTGPYVAFCRAACRCFNQDGVKRREQFRAIGRDDLAEAFDRNGDPDVINPIVDPRR